MRGVRCSQGDAEQAVSARRERLGPPRMRDLGSRPVSLDSRMRRRPRPRRARPRPGGRDVEPATLPVVRLTGPSPSRDPIACPDVVGLSYKGVETTTATAAAGTGRSSPAQASYPVSGSDPYELDGDGDGQTCG